jgi:polysaccharide export outer membrane protein
MAIGLCPRGAMGPHGIGEAPGRARDKIMSQTILTRLAVILLAFGALVACQPSGVQMTPTTPPQPFQPEAYVLRTGDAVQITVFENSDLNGTYRIPAQGSIAFPLIGDVVASGRTVDDVEAELTQRLGSGFLINPRVSVDVAEYRPIYVIGGVRLPGLVPYTPGLSVLGAIAAAGGHSDLAILTEPPFLIRAEDPSKAKVEASVNDPVYPGDIVEVPATQR